MTQNWGDLTKYRKEKAYKSLKEAEILYKSGYYTTSVNRLYYSCFYIISALLLGKKLSSSKHTGIRSLFNIHFVKTGIVDKKLAQIYNDLFERRQEGDYQDFIEFEKEDVSEWIQETSFFLNKISFQFIWVRMI